MHCIHRQRQCLDTEIQLVVYLTILSVTRTNSVEMAQMTVNNELGRMCDEVLTYLRYYPGMRLESNDQKPRQTSLRTDGVPAGIRTLALPEY